MLQKTSLSKPQLLKNYGLLELHPALATDNDYSNNLSLCASGNHDKFLLSVKGRILLPTRKLDYNARELCIACLVFIVKKDVPFLEGRLFSSQSELEVFESFLHYFDWLEKSRPSK